MEDEKEMKEIKEIDVIEVKGVVNVKKHELIKSGYKNFKDWASRKDHVYIGRDMSFYVEGAPFGGSIWGNPFHVVRDTQKPGRRSYPLGPKRSKDLQERSSKKTRNYTLDESLKKYREYIESDPKLIAKLHELKDKELGCWCKPNRCHGDVLVELVKKYCSKK